MKGDLPLDIWWTFTQNDNVKSFNLTTNEGVVIMRTTQKVSMLAIEAVKAKHMGKYSCFAQNKGGSAQFSTYLAINGLEIS